jgi:UPF0716 protein FxsA
MPTESIFDGVALLVAGALLVTPGILTDLAGFLLLLPKARVMLRVWLKKTVTKRISAGTIVIQQWPDK